MSKLIKLSAILLAISLSACAGSPKPPAGWICFANAESAQPYNICFNMETDFDESGNLKPGIPGLKSALQVDKRWNLDPTSFSNLRAYALKWKDRCTQSMQGK